MSGVDSVNKAAAASLGLDAASTELLATGMALTHVLQVYTSSMVRSILSILSRSLDTTPRPGCSCSMGLAGLPEDRVGLHLEEGMVNDQGPVPVDAVLRTCVFLNQPLAVQQQLQRGGM